MTGLVLAAFVFAAALAVAVRRWRRYGDSALFIVRLLPAALLFAIAPVPFGTFQLLRGFQGIAEAGSGGLPVVARIVGDVLEALLIGSLGFVAAIAAAAALDAFATGIVGDDEATSPVIGGHAWLVVLSAAALAPLGWLAWFTRGTLTLVIESGRALTPGSGAASMTADEVAGLSANIAERIVWGLVMGALGTVALVLATVAIALLVRRQIATRWSAICLRVVVVIGSVGAIFGALQLRGDLRVVEPLAQRTPAEGRARP